MRGQAPLRISFSGGGTDVSPYPERYGGCVLSCTINRYANVAVRTRDVDEVLVESRDLQRIQEFGRGQKPSAGRPSLAQAIISRFDESALHCYMHSDAPPGSGLGSSSAMIVALISALANRQGKDIGRHETAELALKIEREDLHIAGGMQDQYAAAFGGFNYMEFTGEGVVVNPLRIPQETLDELHLNLLLCYTGSTRVSAHIIEEQTRNVVSGKPDAVRGLADAKELTITMKRALLRGDCYEFGSLLSEGWRLKKMFASAITNDNLNAIYDGAIHAGALGGKLLGAGGGGFFLFFVPFTKRDSVQAALEQLGGSVMGFQFENRGARAWKAPEKLWTVEGVR